MVASRFLDAFLRMAVSFPLGVHMPLKQLEQLELAKRKGGVVMSPNANRFHDLAAVADLRQHSHLQVGPQLEKPSQRMETFGATVAQLQRDCGKFLRTPAHRRRVCAA